MRLKRCSNSVQAAKVLTDIVKSPDSSNDYINKDEGTIARVREDKALALLINGLHNINITVLE